MDFPSTSAGKESACNSGDTGLILGSGRSLGERIGYPPTPVFLGFPGGSAGKGSSCYVEDRGWEDPLEKGKAIHSSILAWRIPWTFWGHKETQLSNFVSFISYKLSIYPW